MNKILNYQIEDNIAIISIKMTDFPTNLFTMECIGTYIDAAKKAIEDPQVKGIILTSGHQDFMAGADLNAVLDVPVTVNLNGCPNSCARIQIADIGFKGQVLEDGDGGNTEGFQVHLGGSLGLDSNFGRKLRQHKVSGAEVGDYIERVVRRFTEKRLPGERFAQWAVRADEDDLR
jgi:hypothetical protein